MPDVQADIFHLALSCHLGAHEPAAGVSVPQCPFSEISRYSTEIFLLGLYTFFKL